MASQPRRTTRALLVPAAALALLAGPAFVSASAASPRPASLDPGISLQGHSAVTVVVSGRDGAQAKVRAAILAAGGSPLRALPIIDGWSARVPADRLSTLAASSGVTAVTKDRAVHLAGNDWDDSTSASPYVWTSQAAQAWSAGYTGSGVTVAVLDTGVSHVQDLEGRLLSGPDLSGEGQNAVDSFGHGTVMAGIVAGSGVAAGLKPRTGVAPGAKIVSVKVAGANGATDVSTVLGGLSWVGAFKDAYDIRVLSLSWGVPSTQDPVLDPLNFAVERLWTLGVTVVVAAGNSGPSTGTIMKPGDDPLVVTVGAYDDRADSSLLNDVIPSWSSRGPTAQGRAKPDLVAPGRTIVATRAPGSTIEAQNPRALVGTAYIKGSGTSEATAVTAGAAALLLEAHPTWTPDQVKSALTGTALAMPGVALSLQGAGRIQLQAALSAVPGLPVWQVPIALGTGTLTASRGSMAPVSVTCDGQTKLLNDESTSWCSPWDSSAWTGTAWTSSAWTGTAWTGTAWTGSAWTGTAWTGSAWTSSAWTGSAWTGTAWTGSAWTGTAWTGGTYDEATTEDTFLTAFYGAHPKWNARVNGEISESAPGHGRERD